MISKIYQTALNKGARVLENGVAYTCRQSKQVPNRYIQRYIMPDGGYTIHISENGVLRKIVNRQVLKGTSTITDTWDFQTNKGIYLSSVILNEGKSLLSRVFDKVAEKNIKQNGFIYLHHSGNPDKFMTEVRTLNGMTSTPKPFSPMGWLNDQFYKLFDK